MKQQKPILHGRDHNCGGADPIPGYCQLLEDIKVLKKGTPGVPGADYTSIQGAMSVTNSFGSPTPQPVLHWPDITITDAIAHTDAGYDLWAHMIADIRGVEQLSLQVISGGGAIDSPIVPPADYGKWTHVDVSGTILLGTGYSGSDTPIAQVRTVSSLSQVIVSGGIYTLTWKLPGDDPPPTNPGQLWPGSYPIVDSNVSADANIQPTKLQHPGTTTEFLRGDGTWSVAVFQVEY